MQWRLLNFVTELDRFQVVCHACVPCQCQRSSNCLRFDKTIRQSFPVRMSWLYSRMALKCRSNQLQVSGCNNLSTNYSIIRTNSQVLVWKFQCTKTLQKMKYFKYYFMTWLQIICSKIWTLEPFIFFHWNFKCKRNRSNRSIYPNIPCFFFIFQDYIL